MLSSHSSQAWELYASAPIPQRLLAALRPVVCPLAPIFSAVPPNSSVLDVGCGNGLLLVLLWHLGALKHGLGVDISQSSIAAARVASRAAGDGLQFQRISSLRDIDDGRYDVALMVDVMHHLPLSLRKDYFSDVLGRVRPGGRLVYKDMCMKPSWRRQVNILHDLVMAREWVHNEPLERVVGWAREQRCRVVHQDSYTGLGVYGHELVVFEKGQGAAVE